MKCHGLRTVFFSILLEELRFQDVAFPSSIATFDTTFLRLVVDVEVPVLKLSLSVSDGMLCETKSCFFLSIELHGDHRIVTVLT